jgi:hypothetical protein
MTDRTLHPYLARVLDGLTPANMFVLESAVAEYDERTADPDGWLGELVYVLKLQVAWDRAKVSAALAPHAADRRAELDALDLATRPPVRPVSFDPDTGAWTAL